MADINQPWQALLQPPTPVDTVRNPDYDKAMGFDEQPGDTPGQQFAKGLMSSMSRNTPEGRELTMGLAKQKLANQLSLQLEQQKLELEKQYPTYQIDKTPYGAEIFNPKTGDVRTTEMYPGAKQNYANLEQAKAQAETATAQTQANPAYQAAQLAETEGKPDVQKAQIEYFKNRGELDQARSALDLARQGQLGQAKPWTTEDNERVATFVAKKMGINPNDHTFQLMLNSGDKDALARMQAYQAAVEQEIANQKAQRAGAGARGLAAPPQQSSAAPDVSSLMNLNNDGIFKPKTDPFSN